MSSRRDLLKAAAVGAAGGMLVPVRAALGVGENTPELTAPGAPDCTQPTASPRAGWNVYDYDLISTEHVAALRALRPTMIRWIVSWDRYHVHGPKGGSGVPAVPDWMNSPYRTLFEECRPSASNPRGTLVVVQLLCKEPDWTGDARPLSTPGARWARNDVWYGRQYPDRYGIAASYGPFVQSLANALSAVGVETIFGAWNEADCRTQFGKSGAAENFLDPWSVNPFNLMSGVPWFHWSGGAGALWHDLYRQLPQAQWSTSGVIMPNWVQRTAQFPEVDHVDLHLYHGTATPGQFRTWAEGLLQGWDKAAPGLPKRRVFIGESARNSAGEHHDMAAAATLYRRHEALSQANEDPASPFYGRYVGLIAHTGGGGKTPPWKLDPSDPCAAWWQHKAAYASYP